MEEKHYILNEFMAFLSKSSVWIITILSGVIAKISFDVLGGRRLSFVQWCAVVGISVFGGYMMGTYCDSNGWEKQGRWMVPLATLFSEKIIMWCMNNYDPILRYIFLKKKDKEEN
jgi:hypothetical protein